MDGNATGENATCAFWDQGQWSREGVTTLISGSKGYVACATHHLSIFAGVVRVLATNILLALQCSTFSSLVTEESIRELARVVWLGRAASIFSALM